jgi:uncharacterized protein (TIGR02271 family)
MKEGLLISCALVASLAAGCCSSGGHASHKTTLPPPTAYSGAPPETQTTAAPSGELEIVNDQTEIPLRKEELVVEKKEVSNGKVVVRTVVKTEEISKPVDLRKEDYVIERIPASGSEQAATGAFQAREVFIPILREEVISGKRTVLTDTIRIGKKTETDHQTFTHNLRSEDVEVVTNPDLSDPKFKDVPRQASTSTGAPAAAESSSAAAQQSSDPNTIRLAQEELIVGKKTSDGGVYVKKVVRTQQTSTPVDLRREEVSVERTTATPTVVGSADFGTPREVTFDLSKEQATPQTRTVLSETVKLKKKSDPSQQMVSGTVRRQDIEVVRTTGETAQGAPATTETGTQKK